MHNFSLARQNMVDCQLQTNGIVDPDIIRVFSAIPREEFLPEEVKGAAYIDEDLPLADTDCFCIDPLVLARMAQAGALADHHAVLNIGDVSGYSSAVLSSLVSTVVTLESKAGTLDRARSVWDELGCCNIAVINGKETDGCPEHMPYDLVFVNGAIPALPQQLFAQLVVGGKLIAVIKEAGKDMGQITVFEKIGDSDYSVKALFDAATPYARGFKPDSVFVF